jgi:alpha-beta hydrolase superfamily lysophospholipase
VAGCVLIAPALRFLHRRWESLTEAEREAWRTTGVLRIRNEWVDIEVGYGLAEERDRFPPEALPACWATPTLIYHGMADDVVPYADSLAFAEAAGFPDVELRLLKAGDHRLSAFKDVIAEESCRFFERLLP